MHNRWPAGSYTATTQLPPQDGNDGNYTQIGLEWRFVIVCVQGGPKSKPLWLIIIKMY